MATYPIALLTGAEFTGDIKMAAGANYYLSPDGVNARYVIVDDVATYAGKMVIQAGRGSPGMGGAINLYGHSHASHPGDVVAAISSSSSGKFRVNSQALDGGTDWFVASATGISTVGTIAGVGLGRLTGIGSGAGTVAAWRFGDNNSGASRDWVISNGYADGAVDIGALSFAVSSAVNGDPLANTATVILRLTTGNITAGVTLLFSADNTYDIGASGANRPRNLFLANNLTVAGTGTFGSGIGCNGKAAQSAFASGGAAPAGGTGTAAGGWDTAAHRDAAITLLNNIRTALVNNGIMS